MRVVVRRIELIVAFLLVCWVQLHASAEAHPVGPARLKALRLKQTHYFMGDCWLTIAREGMLLENKGRLGFSIVAKAPDWQVTVFRSDDRTCKTQTRKQFESSGLLSDYLVRLHIRDVKSTVQRFQLLGRSALKSSNGMSSIVYLPIDGLTAPEAEGILYAAYKLPTNHGVPLRFVKIGTGRDWMTNIDESGKKRTMLDTKSLETVMVPQSTFDPPKGYTRVLSILEVVSGKKAGSKDNGLKDLLEAGEH